MNSLALVGYGFCVYPILVQHIYMHHVKGGGQCIREAGCRQKMERGREVEEEIRTRRQCKNANYFCTQSSIPDGDDIELLMGNHHSTLRLEILNRITPCEHVWRRYCKYQ